ncbi:hypothetical protein C4561_00175 [candidate division WWE3 bacterium]|jgi:hypothetical protein|uniref:Uncharacterized protein n=1 Tax=candidate division WWE3 bacterium TaxID=2053526 RepID=A0A3A4ZGJ1_UNCKA|nr:MAG: hypothetical protein C4561_00175 [candidate division WWE3 bacterium]
MDLKTTEFQIIKGYFYSLGVTILFLMGALFFNAPDTVLYIILAIQLLIGVPMMVLIEKWIVAEGRRKPATRKLAKMFWPGVLGIVALFYALVLIVTFPKLPPGSSLFDVLYGFVLGSISFVPLLAFGGAVMVMRKLERVYKQEEEDFFRCLT